MRLNLAVVVCGLVVLAGCGGSSNSSSTPTVKAPVANAGGPYTGTAGTAVSFSGASSSDPQGEALTYAWNFGDNGTGTGVSPTHTYAAAGGDVYRHADSDQHQQSDGDCNEHRDYSEWESLWRSTAHRRCARLSVCCQYDGVWESFSAFAQLGVNGRF